jgi:hypothetical protein
VGIYESPTSNSLKEEVEFGRYHYYTCPLDVLPPIDKRTFFPLLLEPQAAWSFDRRRLLKRLAKELNSSMHEPCKSNTIYLGCRVQIIKGLNKPMLSLGVFVILLATLIFSVVSSWVSKTKGPGFSIDQYLVATLSTGLAALYFHLSE